MTNQPTFQLSRLREIGWSKWDPIGLAGTDGGWPADEYDGYLLRATGQLWHGGSDEAVADYLIEIETKHMGLTAVPGIRARALGVAAALREYVETLRT